MHYLKVLESTPPSLIGAGRQPQPLQRILQQCTRTCCFSGPEYRMKCCSGRAPVAYASCSGASRFAALGVLHQFAHFFRPSTKRLSHDIFLAHDNSLGSFGLFILDLFCSRPRFGFRPSSQRCYGTRTLAMAGLLAGIFLTSPLSSHLACLLPCPRLFSFLHVT